MHPEIHIQPMQWAALPDLADAPDLDDTDTACLAEVRDVLARHGKLQRFAMHLAHRHFDLEPGEVLIERPDDANRTQHIAPGRLEDEPNARPTTWLFDDRPALNLSGAVYCACVSLIYNDDSCAFHGKSSSPGPAQQKEESEKKQSEAERNAAYEQGGPVAGHDFRREKAQKMGMDE